jgi:hypothetical protein
MIEGTNHIPGISALAAVLIAAFLIERTVTGIFFTLSFSRAWTARFPDAALVTDPAARAKADRDRKLIWFLIASCVAVILTFVAHIRIFGPIGFARIPVVLDKLLTGLTLVAASDKLAEILKLGTGKPAEESNQAIEVKGTLVVQEPSRGAEKRKDSAVGNA